MEFCCWDEMNSVNLGVGPSQQSRESCVDGMDPCMPKHDIFLSQNSASRGDAGPSHQYRETCLDGIDPCMPKHTIFLSHSGAQKDFTEHLWKELKRVNYNPFFDKDTDSLRNGEKFYPPLKMAAESCRIAILILSNEFFSKTKWPMMELTWFVDAQKSDEYFKILPLFFEISREEMEIQKIKWLGIWKEWAREDPRINVEEWEKALKQISGNHGIPYSGNSEGHATFIEKVVKAVCMLLPPDMIWDISHVRSSEQLSKPILERLAKVEPSNKYKVRVMGLYGVGGIGKTTISRVIYNQKLGEFCGKVCYIELGNKNLVELQKTVLRELTEWREAKDTPIDQHDKLSQLLKQRIHQQKVFLIMDNAWDDQIGEAKMYLNAGYSRDSMVLVTSRSLKILDQLGIRNCDSIEMPELEEDGAIDFFLYYAEIKSEEVDLEFVKRCIQECYFWKTQRVDSTHKVKNAQFHYHPLALKVLGKYFGSLRSETLKWDEKLVKLKAYKIYMLEEKHHPIFSILRLGFDALSTKQQQIFLDLALLWKSKWRNFYGHFKWDWLCKIHRQKEPVMKENINEFQRKGLLDSIYKIEELEYNIHDLYLEFAELVSQEGAFERRRFLIDKSNNDVPHELKDYPSNGKYWPSLERLSIYLSKAQSLERANLNFCKRVEVLHLDSCENLEEVNVSEMVNLRCVVYINCPSLVRWIGLDRLSNLIIFHCSSFDEITLAQEVLDDLASLTTLQVLKLSGLKWFDVHMFLSNFSRCTNLHDLTLSNHPSWSFNSGRYAIVSHQMWKEAHVDFDKYLPISVLKIDFSYCPMPLGSSPIKSMSSLTNLQDLNLSSCCDIKDLTGLCELISLQKLNVQGTGIHELPDDLKKLKELQVLDVSKCQFLSSIVGIAHATALQRVDASYNYKLTELPDDFSSLHKLEKLYLRQNGLICELPRDYDRLAGHSQNGRILEVEGCWGLIAPLVAKLRCPEASHAECTHMNLFPCRYLGGISMQSWIDARKNVNGVAYDLLKAIVFMNDVMKVHYDAVEGGHENFLNMDDEELDDFTIRALCEHDDRRDGTNRFTKVVGELSRGSSFVFEVHQIVGWGYFSMRWVVLATAPCTFGVLMKRARLEPWSKTLFHYTITHILPRFFTTKKRSLSSEMIYRPFNRSDLWPEAIVALLWKCKKKLEEASIQGIEPMRRNEGMKVVDTFLREMKALMQIENDSIMWSKWKIPKFPKYYGNLFPNFPFD